jgi:hypothetical protein
MSNKVTEDDFIKLRNEYDNFNEHLEQAIKAGKRLAAQFKKVENPTAGERLKLYMINHLEQFYSGQGRTYSHDDLYSDVDESWFETEEEE